MGIKIRIINAFNKLCRKLPSLNHGESRGDTVVNTKLTPNLPLDASPTDTPSPKRSRPPAPRTVDFNLPEAVRLAALGYGYRKIARALGNCSHETVRTKLREYEARIEA